MKVILIKDVPNLGKANNVVEVKDGYGKNYLIKNKFALPYTRENVQKLSIALKEIQNQQEVENIQLILIKKEIEKLTLNFELKVIHEKTFGTISVTEIIKTLKKYNFDISKHQIVEKDQWSIGEHLINIQLSKKIIAQLKINVLAKKL